MIIADKQIVVTAPALPADIANACSSFDHLGRTGEQCRGGGQAAPVQSLKRTKRPETRTLTSVMGHSRRPERPIELRRRLVALFHCISSNFTARSQYSLAIPVSV